MKLIRLACLLLTLVSTIVLAQTNPVPLINNPLVPTSAVPGRGGFTLTVNGTGFVAGSVVTWNGVALATNFDSASALSATVPAANVAAAGTASVKVVNPAPGGGVSNVDFFDIRQPFTAVSFGQSSLTVGTTPTSLTAADLNGDGKLDLVVTDGGASAVSVLLGNGDGTFQPQVEYSVSEFPLSVIAGDLNRDGIPDLITAGGGFLCILLGNGDGTFQPQSDISLGNVVLQGITSGDFNKDGNLDLVVTLVNSGQLAVLLGNGDGTFQTPVLYAGGSSRAFSVTTGDFNGDGNLDLVMAAEIVGTYVFLGNGDGTFQNSVAYASGTDGVITADFNGDGKLDLVTNYSGGFSILLGNGDGTFQSQVQYPDPLGAVYDTAAADLNGDGKLDVILNNGKTISTFLGNGDGTFKSMNIFPAGIIPVGLAAGDFNGDGMLDLATSNYSSASVVSQVTSVLSRTNIAFGRVQVGESSLAKVTLTNIG